AAAAAVAEDLGALLAVAADEVAHVLDHAEQRDVELAEHADGLAHVGDRDALRRGDHDRARHRHALGHRQRHVAGAGRQVDDEVVELAPLHVAHELLHRAVQHRPAPDDRLVGRDQHAHRDHLDAVRRRRHDPLVGRDLRRVGDAQHLRDVRAVDVAVEQPDARALPRERDREVHPVVDLPTPPLPAPTATMLRIPATCWRPRPPRVLTFAVIFARAALTPGSAATSDSACAFIWSFTGQAGIVSSIVNATSPPWISTSFTKPSVTMSLWRSGSCTPRSAESTSSFVTLT